jgi:hypothetical protein
MANTVWSNRQSCPARTPALANGTCVCGSNLNSRGNCFNANCWNYFGKRNR